MGLSHGSATHSSSALRSKKRGKVGTGRIIGLRHVSGSYHKPVYDAEPISSYSTNVARGRWPLVISVS
jgi:hypothetical protein